MSIHQPLPSLVPYSTRSRFLPHTASLAPLSVAVFAALVGSGCTSPVSHEASAQASARPRAQRAESAGGVRTGAAYQKAVTAYRARHYADALCILNTLSVLPNLTEQDKAFLLRQRSLCQAAVAGKPVMTNGDAADSLSSDRKRPASSLSQRDCGPRALLFLCQSQHVPANLTDLTRAAHTSTDGTSMEGLAAAAQTVGMRAKGVQVDKDALARLDSPAIAWVDGNHYIAVLSVHDNPWTGKAMATIHDPNHPGKEEMAQSDLLRRSGGILLTVAPKTLAKRQ